MRVKQFQKKVEFERSVLRWVNQKFGEPQLRAVAPRALSEWSTRQRPDVKTLASLQHISELLTVLSNRSGERSSVGFQRRMGEIEQEIDALVDA